MNNVLTKKFSPNLTIDEFIDECKAFIEPYSCPWCEGILLESVIDTCGHSFCKECLNTLLKETTKCPFTKMELSHQLSLNIIVNSVIEKQRVYCKNKESGCEWIGKWSERKSHRLNECSKEIILCEFAPNCKVSCTREEMWTHIESCDYRIIECEYCQGKFPYIEMEEHNKQCPNIPTPCTNCNWNVALSKMNYHIEFECDNTVTECPFSLVGCEFYDMRRILKVHWDTDWERHLKMITTKIYGWETWINNQNNTISTIKAENMNWKNTIFNLEQKVDSNYTKWLNSVNSLSLSVQNTRNYSVIPFANFVPNFYDKKLSNDGVFSLNKNAFRISKKIANYNWYGISSEDLITVNKELKSSMIEQWNNETIIINLKILNTTTSCIFFGVTLSSLNSPNQGGYYAKTGELDNSFCFYCLNSVLYIKGLAVGVPEKERKCVNGDIISMIIDVNENVWEFRRNGKEVGERTVIKDLKSKNIKAFVDWMEQGDEVEFLR